MDGLPFSYPALFCVFEAFTQNLKKSPYYVRNTCILSRLPCDGIYSLFFGEIK